MVNKLSHFVLNNRKLFVLLILCYTIFMAYMGQFVKFNYDFSQTVPDTDEDMIYYNSFKKTFSSSMLEMATNAEITFNFKPAKSTLPIQSGRSICSLKSIFETKFS